MAINVLFYPEPVLAAGDNVFTGSNTFEGATTFAGSIGFSEGITFTGSVFAKEFENILYADQFAGSTADVKIAAAIAALPSTGGTIDCRGFGSGTQTIASTLNLGLANGVPVTLIFDPTTHFVPSSTTEDMFFLLPSARVTGLTADVTGMSGYSANILKLAVFPYNNQPGLINGSATASGMTQLDNFSIYAVGNTTCTGIFCTSIAGTSDFIQFCDFSRISIQGGLYGFHVVTNNTGWFNGNSIYRLRISEAVYGIKCDSSTSGVIGNNHWIDCQIEANGNAACLKGVWLTGSGSIQGNDFNDLNIWDMPNTSATVQVDAAPVSNKFTGLLVIAQVTDTSGDNLFQDFASGGSMGFLTYLAGEITAPQFNASTDSGYRIGGAQVLSTDGSNTYVKPQAASSSVFLSNFGGTHFLQFADNGNLTVAGNILLGGKQALSADGTNTYIVAQATGGNVYVESAANAVLALFYNGGGMGVGAPTGGSQGAGTINVATGIYLNGVAYTAPSDARLKTEITPLASGLDIISALNPVRFEWNDKGKQVTGITSAQFGFIAQEVSSVIPEAAKSYGEWENFDDRAVLSVVVKALQELKAENAALSARVMQLEKVQS